MRSVINSNGVPPQNEVVRIAQYVRKGVGRNEGKDGLGKRVPAKKTRSGHQISITYAKNLNT